MAKFEAVVEKLVKVELKQHQFDALVSFAFNCGEGALAKSTLLRKVNNKDFAGAAQEFHKWTHGGGRVLPGLVRRRASESLLFQGIADENFDGKPDELIHIDDSMPQQVDPPKEKSITESTIAKGAVVVTTASTVGAGNDFWTELAKVPQGAFDLLAKMVEKPNFWLFLVCGAGSLYVIYRRFVMKRDEGV
jgi:hypothetical protein